MKTTDLRLGNYIDKYGKPTKVDLGILQKIENGSVIYKPIPLSEKWLLKLDFQKRDVEFPSYTKKGIQINYLNGKWVEYVRRIEVKTVHKLQNLFYCLSGIDLELPLTD